MDLSEVGSKELQDEITRRRVKEWKEQQEIEEQHARQRQARALERLNVQMSLTLGLMIDADTASALARYFSDYEEDSW